LPQTLARRIILPTEHPGMPSTLHPTGPADYLSLAEQHQHNQSDSGSLYRSHGYLFTGLVLLLPTVRSHVRDQHHGNERQDDGLVIGTRKQKDIKGKGKMNDAQGRGYNRFGESFLDRPVIALPRPV
jgi:hypothetical protein